MNSLEKKMVNTLIDLRENHHVVAIKAEFEAEARYKKLIEEAGGVYA